LPRVRMRSEDHHRAIREEGYQRMARILRERYTAWLVCDWGLGKSGFLACALDEYAGTDFRDIFLLECGDAKNCAEMQELSETQFGVSFQEFCAAISVIPDAVLIFDDLPSALATGDERSSVQSKLIDAMHSFCPNLRMVFIVRQEPSETDPEAIVILRPLEIGETRKYLKMHPRIQSGLDDPDTLERIQSWSDGLPMNLDHLLEQLQVFSLSEILNEGGNPSADRASLSEPIPRALREAVAQLAEAQTERGHQSFRLLKVLTVLRDGEVFQAIKRFYPKEPFYRNNVSELISLGLLEAIPISQTAAELSPRAGRIAKLNADDLKLLRVPPQVRNYMREFITQNEADVILRDSTELLFGKDWRSGQVRLRTALDDSYSHSTISGPGNERVIVQYLIQEALNGGDEHQTKRAILIGLCLCDKLLTLDRFRDAVIASGMMYHLLKNTEFSEDIAESARMSARALRMMDFDQNAIEMSKIALEKGATTYSGVVKASIHLNIAMAHEGLEQKDDALAEAEEVLKLARKESSEWYQAESIIAKFTIEDPTEREQRLRYLLGRARKGGFDMAANNIVFDLLRRQEDAEASLKELESVFKTAKGNYTRARAIIKKSALLAKLGRIGDLTNKDRELLSAAYNYSYAQRIGNLLDRCHKVLWDVFSIEGIAAGMLRLFRLSCFFWTLKGAKDRISQYVRKLDNIDLEELKRAEGRTLDPEILYLQQRRQEYIDTEDDLGREQM